MQGFTMTTTINMEDWTPSNNAWLNFDTTTTTSLFKDVVEGMEEGAGELPMEFIDFSELDNSYKELSAIPEVIEETKQVQLLSPADQESLKASILEEFFPEETKISEFEANNKLNQEVEKLLEAATGEATKIDDALLASEWNFTGLPSPSGMFVGDGQLELNTQEDVKTTRATSVADADTIFNALTSGAVMYDPEANQSEDNNTFSVLGADGNRIQIMIVPAAPESPSTSVNNSSYESAPSPAVSSCSETVTTSGAWSPRSTIASSMSSFEEDTEDDEWSPVKTSGVTNRRVSKSNHLTVNGGGVEAARPRKKYERRAPRRRPDLEPYPANKQDRKKAQNRTAAWKYREKKKKEQDLIDQELTDLMTRNGELKKHLGDLQIQMKCLKQLMIEAGMGHLMGHI